MKDEALTISGINKIWPFLMTGASVIVTITLMNAQVNARLDLAMQKMDQIAQTVNEIKADRATSMDKMRETVAQRNKDISSIQQELVKIKTFIQLP